MTKCAKNISKAFELLMFACEDIRENDRCGDCPRKHMCLNDEGNSVIDYADLVSAEAWQEFLDFADTCLPSDALQDDMAMNAMYDSYRDMEYDIALDEMDRGL